MTRATIFLATIFAACSVWADPRLTELADSGKDASAVVQEIADTTTGLVELPGGTFVFESTVTIDTAQHGFRGLRGANGATRIIMRGAGPAFRIVGNHEGTADPRSFQDHTWDKERFPMISGLEILGENAEADGIAIYRTVQCTIQNVLIRKCRYGIHLTERNRNFLLADSHIYDGGDTGVFLDDCNLHQANIIGNHISYNKRAGIRQANGDVHNIQITGNDIEYNAGSEEETSGEIVLEAPSNLVSEYTISSNTIQARPEHKGANILIIGDESNAPHAARNIAITGNVIGSREKTIEFVHVSRATISGNSIYGGRDVNVHLQHSKNIVLNGNIIGTRPSMHDVHEVYADGILIENSSDCLITGNIITEARMVEGAILIRNSENVRVTACQVINPATRGIVIEESNGCAISDNTITTGDNATAAIIVTGGMENLVQLNLVRSILPDPIKADVNAALVKDNTIFTLDENQEQ